MCLSNLIPNIKFVIKNLLWVVTHNKEYKISKILIKNNLKLSVAESCTGGLISSRITDISGSSAYTFQNFVTYSNEAKEKLLGVSSDSVKEKGVVSEEVSLEMINGLLNNYDCDIALSTTGIAGPSGGTGEKPVGLVYISVGNKKIQKTFKFVENKNLNRILMKYSFTSKALEILLNFLNENY